MSQKPPQTESWQKIIFSCLVETKEWLRAGDLFDLVENEIPLHHATRYCERSSKGASIDGGTAKWRYFASLLGIMSCEWERPRGNSRQPGDRVRLKALGTCPDCGGPTRQISWAAGRTDQQKCRDCGLMVWNRRRTDTPPPEKPMQIPMPTGAVIPPGARTHPLIGLRVDKRDPTTSTIELRNAVIIDVFKSRHAGCGDIAVVEHRDGLRVELIPIAELCTNRKVFTLKRSDTLTLKRSDTVDAA